jgi:hypothetical protein
MVPSLARAVQNARRLPGVFIVADEWPAAHGEIDGRLVEPVNDERPLPRWKRRLKKGSDSF